MKRLFKWLLRLVMAVVVLAVLLLLFKDSILRSIVEHRLRQRTGMEVKIGKFSSSLFAPVFTLENVKVYNPAEFGGAPFLSVAELHLELSPSELTRRNVRVTLARLDLSELDVVRNEQGLTNVISIMDRVKIHTKKNGGWKKIFGDFEFTGVDTLNLSLGKVRYIDLKEPRNSSQASLDLQNQVWRDLTNRAVLEADLIMLWFNIGNKMPFTVNDIIARYVNKPNRKAGPGAAGPPEKTPAPQRQ